MKLKKTPFLTKLLILAICVFALVTLVALRGQIRDERAQITEGEESVMYAKQEQKELEEDIAAFGSDESIIKIARERLGMVAEGEIIFYDADN